MQALNKFYKVIALPLFGDNYSYIISGTARKCLVLVDPAVPSVVINYLTTNFPQYLVSHVIYTHKHWDHAGESEYLAEQLKISSPGVKIIIGEQDKQFVPGSNYGVKASQELKIGNSRVKTVHAPCHTRGHTIFSFLPLQSNFIEDYPKAAEKTMEGKKVTEFDSHSCTFTGDTLFVGGIGRFFEGNAAEMSNNIENMYKEIDLDSDMFCGHEYAIQNLSWGLSVEKQNQAIKDLLSNYVKQEADHGVPCSIPSSLRKERQINVFVRTVTGSPLHSEIEKNPAELMRILREMKNKNQSDYNEFKNRQL